MALACEDGNSKLFEVDVDDEKRVDNILLQIWKLKFAQKIKFLFRVLAQGLVKILKLKFRRDFEASWQWTRHGGRAEGRRQSRGRG